MIESVFPAHKAMPPLPANSHRKAQACVPPPTACDVSGRSSSSRPLRKSTRWVAPSSGVVPRGRALAADRQRHVAAERGRRGHCGATSGLVRGDCARGGRGNLGLPSWAAGSWKAARAECAARCLACARCAYISVSTKWADCSWFAECNVESLRTDVEGFRTFRVRPPDAVPPRRPAVDVRPTRRVAVCLTGHPRTFARRHVYESIGEHMLGGLRAHAARVDLFAVIGIGDAPPKSQRGWRFASVADVDADTERALAFLRPRSVTRYGASWLRVHERCETINFFKHQTERVLAQPAAWSRCYDEVLKAERADGVAYDWVVRARPDAWWYRPHPPLCAPDAAGACSIVLHKLPCNSRGYPDQHFALPRAAARILGDMAQQYAQCNGTLVPYMSLEDWLIGNAEAAAVDLRLPPPQRADFPFVLVRNSPTDPSANYFCCGDAREHAECMRGAYNGTST